ncbi:hypothetical protein ACR9LS_07435 [Helicobacter pylori]
MELEKLQLIDLEVLQALKIFNKLEKKACEWVVNKKRECDKKDNYYKVCHLNNLGKDLCIYLNALKRAKNHKKD